MANKGTPFERKMIKKLYLWWTWGECGDVFYRADGSNRFSAKRYFASLHIIGLDRFYPTHQSPNFCIQIQKELNVLA